MSEVFPDNEPPMSFTVDTKGAYLTRLVDTGGRPILFERTLIDGKTRGGCHVCLPNFGPDASGRLAQHGFGRNLPWEVMESADAHVVELALPHVEGDYAGLNATLRYQSEPTHMIMRLTVYNDGDDERSLPIAPAFHPYFAVPDGAEVVLNDEKLDISQYSGTEYIDGTVHVLRIGERRLKLSSEQLTKWALWTDMRGGYFCVEPTLEGSSFATEGGSLKPTQLRRGEMKVYDFRIDW